LVTYGFGVRSMVRSLVSIHRYIFDDGRCETCRVTHACQEDTAAVAQHRDQAIDYQGPEVLE